MKTGFLGKHAFRTAVAVACLAGIQSGQITTAQEPPPADTSATSDNAPTLPPGVYPSSPLAEAIRLAQSGVSESVIMSYVTNSGSTFNLDADKIIYLKDIGLPDDIVTAMMQRDQVLQAQMAAAAPQPPPPAEAAPAVETTQPPPPEQPAEVTENYFYDTLAPYGAWVDVEGYGRCWRPTAVIYNSGWQPYCDHGHWIYTDSGWYWISDYSWGWAPFHYGRWFHHARFGWCWYPDTVWGPSWVTWRYANDYCGWAPLPPFANYASGVGFTYRGAAVGFNFDFGLVPDYFTFVPTRNFCAPHPRRYRVGPREVTQIYSRTTVINNFEADRQNRNFINHGIAPEKITAVTRADIHPIAIHETTAHVPRGEQLERDGRTLMVNRPHFTANPPPSGNKGALPHATSPAQPEPRPTIGTPYQSPNHERNINPNLQPVHHYQPAAPAAPVNQPPPSRASDWSAPGRNETATPPTGSSAPVRHYEPAAPVQPSPNNNLNSSTDNRRYPTPRMQQFEQQPPRVNPSNSGERPSAPATTQPPANSPATSQFTPPVQQPQRTYQSPRNEASPVQSHPNYSAPPPQPSAPSTSSGQSQKSGGGRGKNQNWPQ